MSNYLNKFYQKPIIDYGNGFERYMIENECVKFDNKKDVDVLNVDKPDRSLLYFKLIAIFIGFGMCFIPIVNFFGFLLMVFAFDLD